MIPILVVIALVSFLFIFIIGHSNSNNSSSGGSSSSSGSSSSRSSSSSQSKSTNKNKSFKTSNSSRKLNDDDVTLCKLLGLDHHHGYVTNQVVLLSLDMILLNIINDNSNDSNSNRDNVINTIKHISQLCVLFIIANVKNDDDQQQILNNTLHEVIDNEYLPIHRILFYETDIGKIAIVRQLNPSIYIDNCSRDLDKLSQHIPQVISSNLIFNN